MPRPCCTIAIAVLLFARATHAQARQPLFPDGVGSNLVFHELGAYASDPTGKNWERDVQVTLLHYHEHQAEVRDRLKQMRANGQTVISLMLWYVQEGAGDRPYYSHVICPKGGKIPEQIERNIRDILKDIAAAGYESAIVRLAAQGLADPFGESYDPKRVADSWKLFENLYTLCEDAIQGTKLAVRYDLSVEIMGHPFSPRPAVQAFLKSMWANYVAKYPPSKTVGFSLNHAHDPGTLESLRIYQDSNTWPSAIAIDLYEDPDKHLANLAKALAALGKPDHPIIITETFRNNKEMADVFVAAQRKYKLNFHSLLQWPLDKGAKGHSNNPLTPHIDAYKGLNVDTAP